MNPTYIYEVDDYGNNKVVGFEYQDETYIFEYDDRGIITYICDSEGNRIVYYNCDAYGNNLEICSMTELGWVNNSDETFIGNVNKMRWLGYEYCDTTDTYVVGERHYSAREHKYTDGVDNSFAFSETNPFLASEEEIMVMDSYYNDLAAEEWAEALLADSSYGVALGYSNGWYNGLSTVELLARCIFAEGGTVYTNEENAVAWVILNRVHSSSFPSTPRGVITSGDFASITGQSGATLNAREPAADYRWRHSTYLACLMLTTTDSTEWRTLVPSEIGGQLFFYSYTTAKINGGVPFSGTSSSGLYYNSRRIKNVYVLGYGSVSSFSSLFSQYNPTNYSRNIFYDYY
ncbi:MAG: hypothetical protein ACI4GD_06405 [Lachnospiraceae bacterium]